MTPEQYASLFRIWADLMMLLGVCVAGLLLVCWRLGR
jgi:hypothetical protein